MLLISRRAVPPVTRESHVSTLVDRGEDEETGAGCEGRDGVVGEWVVVLKKSKGGCESCASAF